MPDNKQHIALSMAGFDPCGGAGTLADIQAMQGCKINGMAVLTAITSQNEDEITKIKWLGFEEIISQLDSLLSRYRFEVVKIGIVENLIVLNRLVDHLRTYNPKIKIIWDPIFRSSSGTALIDGLSSELMPDLLNKLYLITPNLTEYEILKAYLTADLKTNILIKGGHSGDGDTSDTLIESTGDEIKIPGQRIPDTDKHGTGCVLSSAIASGLVRGMKLKTACIFGKRYVEGYLRSGLNKLGAHYEIEI